MSELRLNTTALRQALKGWEQHQSGHNLKTQTGRLTPGHTPDFNRFARQVQQHQTIQRLTPLGQIFIGPRLFNSQVLRRYAIFNDAFSPLERVIRLRKRLAQPGETGEAWDTAPEEAFDNTGESEQYYYQRQPEAQVNRSSAFSEDDLTASLFEPSLPPPEPSGFTGRLAEFKPPVLRSLTETTPDNTTLNPHSPRPATPGSTGELPRFTQLEPGFPAVNQALEGPEAYSPVARSFVQNREARPTAEEQITPSPRQEPTELNRLISEDQSAEAAHPAPVSENSLSVRASEITYIEPNPVTETIRTESSSTGSGSETSQLEPGLVNRLAETAYPDPFQPFSNNTNTIETISPLGRALARSQSQTEENEAISGETVAPGSQPENQPTLTALQRVLARAEVVQRLEEGSNAGQISGPEMSHALRRPVANSDNQESTGQTTDSGSTAPAASASLSGAPDSPATSEQRSAPVLDPLSVQNQPETATLLQPSIQNQPESGTLPTVSRASLLMGAETVKLEGNSQLQRLVAEPNTAASWVENLPALRYFKAAQAHTEETRAEAGESNLTPFQPTFVRSQPASRQAEDTSEKPETTGRASATSESEIATPQASARTVQPEPGLTSPGQRQPQTSQSEPTLIAPAQLETPAASTVARALSQLAPGTLENISQPALTRAIERAILAQAQEEGESSDTGAFSALGSLFSHPNQLKSGARNVDRAVSDNTVLEATPGMPEASPIQRAVERASQEIEVSPIQRAIERISEESVVEGSEGAAAYFTSGWNERSYTTPPLVWRKLGDYQPGEAAFPADNPAFFGQWSGEAETNQAAPANFAQPLELSHPATGHNQVRQNPSETGEITGEFVPPTVQAAGQIARQLIGQQNWAAELPSLAQNPALMPAHLRTTPAISPAMSATATPGASPNPTPANPVSPAGQAPLAAQHLAQPAAERMVERSTESAFGEAATSAGQNTGRFEDNDNFAVAAPAETRHISGESSREPEPLAPPTLNMLHPTTWVQRKASDGNSTPTSPIGLPSPENLLRTSVGQPLEPKVQRTMSQTFGMNFEHVRVHTGDEASGYVSRMGAEAFTTGPNIFFAPGRYQPETPGGQALIGHELTHVVQQASLPALGGGRMPETSSEGQTLEREALHNESLILRHLSSPLAANNAETNSNSAAPYFDPGPNAVSSYAPIQRQHLHSESAPAAPSQPPLQDVLNNPVVERVIQRVETETAPTSAPVSTGEGHAEGVDLEALAQKVLQMLKQELKLERERQGIPSNRFY